MDTKIQMYLLKFTEEMNCEDVEYRPTPESIVEYISGDLGGTHGEMPPASQVMAWFADLPEFEGLLADAIGYCARIGATGPEATEHLCLRMITEYVIQCLNLRGQEG